MPLFFHELSHLILSLVIALIVSKKYHNHIGVFIAALLGGILIDLDHLIDYFLAFGTKFNLTYFLKGYQFLKTDKIYVPLHSWELVIILLLTSLFLLSNLKTRKGNLSFRTKGEKSRSAIRFVPILLLTFSISLFLHLSVDVFTNNMLPQSYFLTYRVQNNFNLKKLVTPSHYQKHLQLKNQVIF